ncbi:MAG: hypothetical protein CME70_23800 [Halobacteriovorax sp.]|nr:hypothetical protein [Halobacteriovorax sp.]|tara:strand:- start:73982 stop:74356 length:375 start_codon:yes stop_codon:yes gene_type:complete
MWKFSFILLITIGSLVKAHAYERSDAFIVRVFEKRIKVLAPKKYSDQKTSVIIENKTLVKGIFELTRKSGKRIKYISVNPGKFKAVELNLLNKRETFYFVPVSPPFQKVELVPGSRPYEIPPKG